MKKHLPWAIPTAIVLIVFVLVYFFYWRPRAMRNQLISDQINAILNDPTWMEALEKKAVENQISIEEQVYLDAVYVLESQNLL